MQDKLAFTIKDLLLYQHPLFLLLVKTADHLFNSDYAHLLIINAAHFHVIIQLLSLIINL